MDLVLTRMMDLLSLLPPPWELVMLLSLPGSIPTSGLGSFGTAKSMCLLPGLIAGAPLQGSSWCWRTRFSVQS